MTNESVLIARSEPRERMSVAHGVMWTEWRLRRLSAADYDALRASGHVGRLDTWREWVVEQRRIKTDGETTDTGEWAAWCFGHAPAKAVAEGLGDSSYLKAISLHLLHEHAVRRIRTIQAANDALYAATLCLKAATSEVETYKIESNREFHKKTAGKRDTQIEAIKKRMLAKRQPVYSRLRHELEERKAALVAAEKAVKEVQTDGENHY